MSVRIADNGTTLHAFATDGFYLGGAQREYAIGSRGQRPWWSVQVGDIRTDVHRKPEAVAELRYLAAVAVGQMPAITVRLPWAAALRAGAKLVENRGQPIPDRYVGQQMAIHASATYDRYGGADRRIRTWWWRTTDVRLLLNRGPVGATEFSYLFRKVIAVGTLVDCHPAVTTGADTCCVPWGDAFYGIRGRRTPAWHYVFADMVALPEPLFATGSLLLPWMMPADVTTLVRAQLKVDTK